MQLLSLLAIGCASDGDPPVLSLALEPAAEESVPMRGTILVAIGATDAQQVARVELVIDALAPIVWEAPVPQMVSHSLDTTALPDGSHLVTVTAVDASRGANRSFVAQAFTTDNTPPSLLIAEVSLKGSSGQTMPVFVKAEEQLVDPVVHLGDKTLPLYELGGGIYRSLMGISVKQEPGTFPLTVTAADEHGNVVHAAADVVLTETPFEKGGFIKLSKQQQANQKDDSKNEHDRDLRNAAFALVEPRQLWGGAFARPVEGSISSPFGKFREYNSGVKSHHLGLDLSNEPETPIVAANDGVVVLAELLYIMGNHVVIQHGQGVSSAYSHLTAIGVKKGQQVKRGEFIGTLGSTGQSTGPHLHWELVVSGGTKVSPLQFEQTNFAPPPDLVFRPLVPSAAVPAAETAEAPETETEPGDPPQ